MQAHTCYSKLISDQSRARGPHKSQTRLSSCHKLTTCLAGRPARVCSQQGADTTSRRGSGYLSKIVYAVQVCSMIKSNRNRNTCIHRRHFEVMHKHSTHSRSPFLLTCGFVLHRQVAGCARTWSKHCMHAHCIVYVESPHTCKHRCFPDLKHLFRLG